MKKTGRIMGILMGVTLSLVLSFVGVFTSGRFTLPGFLSSFGTSLLISLLIGFLVPMPRLNAAVGRKLRLERGSLKARFVESLISDLLYTPVISIAMVTLAWMNIGRMGGQQPPYVPMLLRSLLISMVVAYLFIFLITPVFLRIAMKTSGAAVPPGEGQPRD